ncbi:hypothetical protein F511_21857 [Dorcoceras hygrometricum]|uniref:Uncharacterized protein n=1 Tax=Dorcoceras hygrometricum TaxID=472368 RepID=A0A2Z7CT75_9LAMI|nr:hypothetical protein F511_21857 [Dorcoceras hygrometricum]
MLSFFTLKNIEDAVIEDEQQYRAPHLPAGLVVSRYERVGSYHALMSFGNNRLSDLVYALDSKVSQLVVEMTQPVVSREIKITKHGLNRSELNMTKACMQQINVQNRTYTTMQSIHSSKHNHPCSIKAIKQAHIRTSSLLSYNYHKTVPSNTDLTPAKPNTDTSSRTVAQKLRIGSYELNQICPTLLTQQKALNKAQDRILTLTQQAYLKGRSKATLMLTDYQREMSRNLINLDTRFQKLYQTKRLSVRSPRYHSYFNRSCLPSAIGEDKVR